jgi:hypothetical protein
MRESEVFTCEDLFQKCRRSQSQLPHNDNEKEVLTAFLTYCMIIDTFAVATLRLEFMLDSNNRSRSSNNYYIPGHFDPTRKLTPTLAKNTIW